MDPSVIHLRVERMHRLEKRKCTIELDKDKDMVPPDIETYIEKILKLLLLLSL